jgi:tol-pal system protein YbgF
VKDPYRALRSFAVASIFLNSVVALPALAAAPVEESRPVGSYPAATSGAASGTPQPGYGVSAGNASSGTSSSSVAASGDPSRLSELFYQLQVLQQEVQELHGKVEEQSYQINRLARDQQEQYLDLDRRMQSVRANAQQPAGVAIPDPAAAGGTGSPRTSTVPVTGSERDAYTSAFDLMKARQFDASADAFNQLIVDYPNGAYTANAFYWLGELYLAKDEMEKARQSFVQVTNLYSDHQKAPDALYKLGVVYHRLGDDQRAREYLNRARTEYPQSSAAGLAQTYLAELQ